MKIGRGHMRTANDITIGHTRWCLMLSKASEVEQIIEQRMKGRYDCKINGWGKTFLLENSLQSLPSCVRHVTSRNKGRCIK